MLRTPWNISVYNFGVGGAGPSSNDSIVSKTTGAAQISLRSNTAVLIRALKENENTINK